jgi:hypothetical protein
VVKPQELTKKFRLGLGVGAVAGGVLSGCSPRKWSSPVGGEAPRVQARSS